MKIVFDKEVRENAQVMEYSLLKQKFNLMKGFLCISLNNFSQAQDAFLECMESEDVIDPRIRRECIKQLIFIHTKLENINHLESLAIVNKSFEKKDKDVIFLVSEYCKPRRGKLNQINIRRSLELIFDNCFDPNDNLALFQFNQNVYKIFNLVGVNKN